MAEDIVKRLHNVARTDEDPERRAEAIRRLQRRGAWTKSAEDYESLASRWRQNNLRTERLRAEQEAPEDPVELAKEVGSEALKRIRDPRIIARESITGAGDMLDSVSGGLYRRGRDAAYDAVDPTITEDLRSMEAETPKMVRDAYKMTPALAAGNVVATAAPAFQSAGLMGRLGMLGAAEMPLATSRRVSEGEDLPSALAGGAKDAATGMAVGGAMAGAGKVAGKALGSGDEILQRYRQARRGGAYKGNSPARTTTDAELDKLAFQNMRKAAGGLESQRRRLGAEYQRASDAALAKDTGVRTDAVEDALAEFAEGHARGGDGGVPKDIYDAAFGDETLGWLSRDNTGKMPIKNLLGLRRDVARNANFESLDPSKSEKAYRDLYGRLNRFIHDVDTPAGKALRDADRQFASDIAEIKSANRILFRIKGDQSGQVSGDDLADVPDQALLDDPDLLSRILKIDEVKEITGTNAIRYSGELSTPGTVRATHSERLRDINPESRQAIDLQRDASAFRQSRAQAMPGGRRMRDAIDWAGRNKRALQRGFDTTVPDGEVGPLTVPVASSASSASSILERRAAAVAQERIRNANRAARKQRKPKRNNEEADSDSL